MEYLNVKEFYEGKNILVSGCTGFLGKVILEKLLRTTNFGKIFVLIRKKKSVDLESRMNKEIYDTELFKTLFLN
jgi:fatty acyl-CoA reductase